MIEPSEQYEIENERMNEIAILQNELQSLREKLRESEAGAAEMRECIETARTAYPLQLGTSKLINRVLSSTAGSSLLKELESLKWRYEEAAQRLKNYDDVPVKERAGYIGLQLTGHKIACKNLEAKLAVAVEALEHVDGCLDLHPNLEKMVEQALAKISEKGEV